MSLDGFDEKIFVEPNKHLPNKKKPVQLNCRLAYDVSGFSQQLQPSKVS